MCSLDYPRPIIAVPAATARFSASVGLQRVVERVVQIIGGRHWNASGIVSLAEVNHRPAPTERLDRARKALPWESRATRHPLVCMVTFFLSMLTISGVHLIES